MEAVQNFLQKQLCLDGFENGKAAESLSRGFHKVCILSTSYHQAQQKCQMQRSLILLL